MIINAISLLLRFGLCSITGRIMTVSPSDSATNLLVGAGLPGDFLDRLLSESDWSFVIKLHALFEAVVASLVVKELGVPELQDVIMNLDFNHSKTGQVAFARALKLVDAKEANFLRGLSELRNLLVHDIRQVQFKFQAHITGMDANQRKTFKDQFGQPLLSLEDGEAMYQRYLTERPSVIVYFAAYNCLMSLEFNLSSQRRKRLVEALMKSSQK